jgi:hypothetical protein
MDTDAVAAHHDDHEDPSSWMITIYGTISVAVVLAEYPAAHTGRLALIVLGYAVSLWLAHGYAGVVSASHATWRSSLGHSWPVAEAGLPALVVLGLGTALGWSNRLTLGLALTGCLVNVVSVQVAVLRRGRTASRSRIVASVVTDLAVGAIVLAILSWLR